jgi:Ca-activated chloride channel homolog
LREPQQSPIIEAQKLFQEKYYNMQTPRFIYSSLLIVSSLTATTVFAQPTPPVKPQEKPAKADDPQVVKNITTNIRLPVSVIDKGKRFVVDLKQEDFEVYEDKVKQEILEFKSESDLPLDIALLMDTSNSVKPKLKFQRDAAVSFLQTVLRIQKDKALFLSFNSDVELQQDFTNRIDLLAKAIDKAKAYGETRLYDAVYSVCEEKMNGQSGHRRVIVLITDGEDTASEHTLEQTINIALKTETTVFVISNKASGFFGVQGGQVDSSEDKYLKRLAEETGGSAAFSGTVIELEKLFSRINKELRSQYMIVYSPSNDNYNGKMREIDMKLPGKKDLQINTRKRYPADPPPTIANSSGGVIR